MALRNWAGNYTYGATALEHPQTLDELRRLVSGADASVRAVATRHTFTGIGDAEMLIGLDRLSDAGRVEVDAERMLVSVGPAVTFAELSAVLNRRGLALANLASLPHISVCGGVATATHGSGDKLGNLATLVRGMRILTADGEIVTLTAGDARLTGAAVHLGLLGVVIEVTLAVVPYYELSQTVFERLEWDVLFEHLDEVFALGRSVSIFHRLGSGAETIWVKAEADRAREETSFGALPASIPMHPIPGGDSSATTTQLGEPGPWSERLPHFRSGFTPSNGSEIQSEVFVERGAAASAVRALLPLREQLAPVLLVGELRTVARDELWLSPHHRRSSLGIHFTWRREPPTVAAGVALIEQTLAPFAIRPHWGKVFSVGPEALAAAYPRAGDFAKLRAEFDPHGRFINAWARQQVPFLLEA